MAQTGQYDEIKNEMLSLIALGNELIEHSIIKKMKTLNKRKREEEMEKRSQVGSEEGSASEYDDDEEENEAEEAPQKRAKVLNNATVGKGATTNTPAKLSTAPIPTKMSVTPTASAGKSVAANKKATNNDSGISSDCCKI